MKTDLLMQGFLRLALYGVVASSFSLLMLVGHDWYRQLNQIDEQQEQIAELGRSYGEVMWRVTSARRWWLEYNQQVQIGYLTGRSPSHLGFSHRYQFFKQNLIDAQAALAVKEIEGEEAYVRFVDEMMRNAGPANVATVLKVLTKLGHDAEEIVKAIKEGKGADELNRARDLADALGVTGTPYFVGPGGIIRGVASKDRLQALTVADGSDS